MSDAGFSAEWLALREPADTRARARDLTRTVVDALPNVRSLSALDLGSGTGANVRYLSAFIRTPQRWILADHSAALLQIARAKLGAIADTEQVDLARIDAQRALFEGRDLVTASALLDLVSQQWLEDALSHCRRAGAAVLFALNYDGRMVCSPTADGDELVRDLVNRHQRTDKGFGRALGPAAADTTQAILEQLGYQVLSDDSDWQLGAEDGELQWQLVDGWARAALEIDPDRAGEITEWHRARQRHIASGHSRIVVGHRDVAGLLV